MATAGRWNSVYFRRNIREANGSSQPLPEHADGSVYSAVDFQP